MLMRDDVRVAPTEFYFGLDFLQNNVFQMNNPHNTTAGYYPMIIGKSETFSDNDTKQNT